MKVKITGHHRNPFIMPMWYIDLIGEQFEVAEERPESYSTVKNGMKHLIWKEDCEVMSA